MTHARPKEGPRAPLFYSALALLCGGLAQAQTVDISELERCAELDAAEAKLACFEAITAGQKPAAEAAPEAAPSPEPVASPSPEPAPAPASVVAPVSAVSPSAGGPAPAPTAPDPEPHAVPAPVAASPANEAPSEAPAPPTPAATAVPPAASDAGFGSEHLETAEESRSRSMTATVVDVTKASHGELVFHLDNGQVWAQMEKRYYPYPRDRQFEVEITTGVLNEYQLRVDGAGRKVTVKRVK